MGILDRSIGHPANWVDYAIAWELVQDRWLVNMVCEVNTEVIDGKGVLFSVSITAVPSVFSPHSGKRKVVKVRQGYVTSGHPLSEIMYSCLWEIDATVGIIWPVGMSE